MNCKQPGGIGRRLSLLLLGCAACCRIGPALAQAHEGVPALQRPALMAPQSMRGAMLAVALAGPRIVAVGERGVVLVSDDRGATWRQVVVPVSVSLTAVRFVNDKTGWATGHGGVVLATRDGGETWTRQLDGVAGARLAMVAAKAMEQRVGADNPVVKQALTTAAQFESDGPDKPLLDLYFSDVNHGMVVGAYGLAFITEDGGKTWQSVLDRLDNPKGLHFNAITGDGQNIVIAGEKGLVLLSTDGGKQFVRVETPYKGSWFAVHVGPAGQLVLGGLKGNAYFSPDLGATSRPVDFGMQTSITSITSGRGARLLAANQAGLIFASTDAGRSFERLPVQGAAFLTALTEVENDVFVLAGLRGVQRVNSHGNK
jgi:photosystem II stability/assembly factor-like uncharacterized protein